MHHTIAIQRLRQTNTTFHPQSIVYIRRSAHFQIVRVPTHLRINLIAVRTFKARNRDSRQPYCLSGGVCFSLTTIRIVNADVTRSEKPLRVRRRRSRRTSFSHVPPNCHSIRNANNSVGYSAAQVLEEARVRFSRHARCNKDMQIQC